MRGDIIRIDGIEYESVWNGDRADPSLLGEYTGGSTLGPISADSRQRGFIKNGTTRQLRHTKTFLKARAEVRRLERG